MTIVNPGKCRVEKVAPKKVGFRFLWRTWHCKKCDCDFRFASSDRKKIFVCTESTKTGVPKTEGFRVWYVLCPGCKSSVELHSELIWRKDPPPLIPN